MIVEFSAEFKMQIVLEAIKSKLTVMQLAEKYDIPAKKIMNWKQQFFDNAHLAFDTHVSKDDIESLKKENAKLEKSIHKTVIDRDNAISKLQKLDISIKKQIVDPNSPELSIAQQCKMIDLNRPSLYYEPKPLKSNDEAIMKYICEVYQNATSYYGYRMMHQELLKKGYKIGVNKVHKLIKILESQQKLKQLPTSSIKEQSKYSHVLHNLDLVKPLKL